MEATFEGLGWKVRLRKKRESFFLTLVKQVVLGNVLKSGDELYYYLVKAEGRNAILLYLDGQEREKENQFRIV